MKASTQISKLQGKNLELVKANINANFSVTRNESSDKNINHFYLNDKELNSVTLYSSLGKVHKISFNYNFVK